MIYEGTNEIQAIDLLVRKGVPDGGARLTTLFDWMQERLPEPDASPRVPAARLALDRLRETTTRLLSRIAGRPSVAHEVADAYLHLVAFALLSLAWARMDAAAALAIAEGRGEPFHDRKRVLAAHYEQHVALEAGLHAARVEAVGSPLASLEA